MEKAETFSDLKSYHKKAVGLLSIGTFLEYFDLMLYVHMAVFLNELFFKPTNDPDTAALFSAAAFCSTFVFRPVGGYIFGRLGDTIGRKSTVVITTFIMAACCVVIATLPPYAKIGVTASWTITICRILQGLSSSGEVVGAQLYLTELLKPPVQYPLVAFIRNASVIGTTAALGFATLATRFNFEWRSAFLIGALVALIGTVARTTLKETPDFADANRRMKATHEQFGIDKNAIEKSMLCETKVNQKTTFYLLVLNCVWPICFYFVFVYCSGILKKSYGFSAAEVIKHNFRLSIIQLIWGLSQTILSYKIYPLKILKVKWIVFLSGILFLPYILGNISTVEQLFSLQLFIIIFAGGTSPAIPIFFKNFPVFKRFTYNSVISAVSRTMMYVVTSFGIGYIIKYCGYYGLSMLLVPISILGVMAVNHFEKLEKAAGRYPEKRKSVDRSASFEVLALGKAV